MEKNTAFKVDDKVKTRLLRHGLILTFLEPKNEGEISINIHSSNHAISRSGDITLTNNKNNNETIMKMISSVIYQIDDDEQSTVEVTIDINELGMGAVREQHLYTINEVEKAFGFKAPFGSIISGRVAERYTLNFPLAAIPHFDLSEYENTDLDKETAGVVRAKSTINDCLAVIKNKMGEINVHAENFNDEDCDIDKVLQILLNVVDHISYIGQRPASRY